MTKFRTLACTLVGAMVLLQAAAVFAQDWPQWRGPNRDGTVSGFTPPQTWPEELTRKWTVTVGQGDATPALVDDKLYVFARQGGDEVTLCLNASDGTERWLDRYAAITVKGAAGRHAGPRSSPAVAEGKVVTLGVGGILSCLDAATGEVLWRKDEFPNLAPRFFTASSPLIVDGTCIAHLGGKDNGALMAFDLATGGQRWAWDGDSPAYASPVLMTVGDSRQVVIMGEKSIAGIDLSDGTLLWRVPFEAKAQSTNSVTPIVFGSTVIYGAQGRGTMAISIEKDGAGFVTKNRWINEKLAPGFTTPVLKDGLLFGLSDRGQFFCMNAETGEEIWSHSERGGRFGALLDGGSVILALPSSSELIVFDASKRNYTERARFTVADTPIYAHPVVAGDRIFVKDQETLALLTLK